MKDNIHTKQKGNRAMSDNIVQELTYSQRKNNTEKKYQNQAAEKHVPKTLVNLV